MPQLDDVGPALAAHARLAIDVALRGPREVEAPRAAQPESEPDYGESSVPLPVLPRRADRPPRAPVFVTLRRADGALRGCIGSLEPTERDVFEEVAHYAVLASRRDPRFAPVTLEELPSLQVEVSVLYPLELVRASVPDGPLAPDVVAELEPRRYGVVVTDAAGHRGVLLPDLDGVATVEEQVRIARRKACVAAGAPVRLERFEVRKFGELPR